MDVQFHNNFEPPVPRDQVKIEQVEIVSYPDRFRVYVHVHVTAFLERPNLLLVVRDEDDKIAAELNIIETMHNDMEFTLHLRGKADPAGVYSLTTELFYETRNPPQDRVVEAFIVPSADEMGENA